ncbi:bidirectional sugar transporter SWEET3b [Cryptomeria japonica]|uniref:bidirectional sugar transporter SWEET3b n=1 Tax=Cryptomeria japonica TaxID=3369 RepID=UPI0027DA73F7|nr:bidirectional sugar transporter SWEET3b [Cryptomeria japonica]
MSLFISLSANKLTKARTPIRFKKMEKQLRLAVGIMGNCTSLLMYMSPVITFVKVIRDKSVGHYSCTPYVIALFNCFTYTWYGMPVVSKGWENILLSTVNGAGIIPECFFICTYLILAPPKAKLKVVRMVAAAVVLFTVMAMVSTFALHEHKTRKFFVGIVGILTSIALYGSPLVIMKLVITTKSVEFMPFYLSFFGSLASILWMTYGVLSKDVLIAAPNVIGCLLGIAQLVLYCIYKNKKKMKDPEAGIKNGGAILNEMKTKVIVDGTPLSRKDNRDNDQPI